MKRLLLFIYCSLLSFYGLAAQVDTLAVYSSSMQKEIKTVVIVPEDYDDHAFFPVVYLLHGYGGTYSDWVKRAPDIKELADRYSMILVCPDGGKDSWYWDSPQVGSYNYETFFTKELIPWIDSEYKTTENRSGRAITGLSMGGQGALYLSFRNLDLFGAAGSTAGGVDIRPFPTKWGMARHLGTFRAQPEAWNEHAITEMLYLLEPGSLQLMIDCGTGDFFYPVNEALHEKLLLRGIPHRYVTGPGKHNWEYWQQSIAFQLLFFHQYFESVSS